MHTVEVQTIFGTDGVERVRMTIMVSAQIELMTEVTNTSNRTDIVTAALNSVRHEVTTLVAMELKARLEQQKIGRP